MNSFTERESQLMAIAWQCFSEQPKVRMTSSYSMQALTFLQIDFDKMAGLAGYTNTKSCSNAWANIKKKLAAGAQKVTGGAEGNADGDDTPKTKGTPRKRGKKVTDEGDEEGESPAKKAKTAPKKRGGKKAAVEEKGDEAQAGEDDGAVKAEETDELV
ncbi:hypothetical protein DOTSEDRAFT_20034 [Dothistroma septosporum NZE10]|uniref:Uncharacterized protein n=1 Tax=Dothistroma septosporum (strain NZE10 / CBS 128990) TaxID=675120 RepID=N1Q4A7_DOTSN|nr:hypothetical protein DOTSEDRAFT_20034 [Dothistroma septosporum NZE10]